MSTWIGIGITVFLIGVIGYFSNKSKRFDNSYNEHFEMEKERTRQSSNMFTGGMF